MTTINNVPLRTDALFKSMESAATAPLSRDQVKAADVDAIVAQASARVDTLERLFQAPELNAPSSEALAKVASQEWLQKVLKDEDFIQQAEQGLKSIVGLAHRSTELIDKFAALMLSLVTAANKTTQRNIILGSELAVMKKESGYREASSVLGGAISSAAVSTSLSAGGTAMSLKGSGIKGDAIKHNKVKVDTLTTELKASKASLASQGSVKLGADKADSLTQLKPKAAPGAAQQGGNPAGLPANPARGVGDTVDGVADNAVPLQASNKRLDQQQMEALHRPTEQIEADIAAQDNAFQTNTLRGSRLEAKGNAVAGASHAASAITRGGADYSATLERADQGVLQSDQQVANTAAEKSSEEERKLSSLLQDLLRTVAGIMQDTSSANGQIASNRPG